ncbi:MAG TPA: hypothetical protein VK593_02135, partial [Edaphobacter sp.]|nr:hypothetical protein [Edaphobacter sp.]HMG02141.1 hypothetical protein [Edaphobacter sp.]
WCIGHHRSMSSQHHPLLKQAFAYWNWKCALMSATARSLVYLAAMAHTGSHGALPIVLVEMGYVTLTAGVYAGMQQNALRLRSRLLGNLIVVLGVPGLAQTLDWFTHRLTHTTPTHRTILVVSFFAVLSALFHLHVMRNGGFLTGQGRSLLDDFRRVPRFIAGFVLRPVDFLTARISRPARSVEPEAGL